jgi:hypothetical protein
MRIPRIASLFGEASSPAAPLDPVKWGWADDIPESVVQQMAEVALPLFVGPERWVHRRVERINFIDRQTICRQVSVDFTLPSGLTPVGNFENRDIYLAPLFLLSRDHPHPFRLGRERHWWSPWRDKHRQRLPMSLRSKVTLTDECGNHLPLLTHRQSGHLSSAMLHYAARKVINQPLSEALGDQISTIALGDRFHRKEALESIFVADTSDANLEALRNSYFAEFACTIATHFPVVCLFTDGPPGRSIVKVAYIEPLDKKNFTTAGRFRRSIGWKSEHLSVGVSEIGAAASHHIEIAVPSELQVNFGSLTGKRYALANVNWRDLEADEKDYVIRQVGSANNSTVYLTDLPYARRMGRASVKMRVRRSRFLLGAFVASAIITAVLTALTLLTKTILETSNSDASVAALLLLPSVVATYIARPGEHMITARMLRWARFALVGNAALPFLAVLAFLTTPEAPSTRAGVALGGIANKIFGLVAHQDSPAHGLEARWAILAGVSTLFTCLFIISNIWPKPHGESEYRPLPET